MKNFMIGMPFGIDHKKYERDFREDFFGIEINRFENISEVEQLKKLLGTKKLGIHFPMIPEDLKCRDPLFLSLDEADKEKAYSVFEKELAVAAELEADYMLAHFPKPVLLDKRVDWKFWRFANAHEWMWEDDYPYELFAENCEKMFERLSRLYDKYGVKIVLEHDALNKYIYEGDLLLGLLEKYKNIKLCLDTGRLHLQDMIDTNFDSKSFAEKYAPHTYLVHLWDVKVSNSLEGGHFPVLPVNKKEEGWADTKAYMEIITSVNKAVKVMFEHRSDLVSDEQLQNCYDWIAGFFKEDF